MYCCLRSLCNSDSTFSWLKILRRASITCKFAQLVASLLKTYPTTTRRTPPLVLDRAINCPPYKTELISESSFPTSKRFTSSAIAVKSLQWLSPASKRVGRWGAEALSYPVHLKIRAKRCVRSAWRLLGWSLAVYIVCCRSSRLVFVDRWLISSVCLQELEVWCRSVGKVPSSLQSMLSAALKFPVSSLDCTADARNWSSFLFGMNC